METKPLIGYARVSTTRQKMELQIHQLRRYAEEHNREILIFSETASASKKKFRPVLTNAINAAKEYGTPLVVTYLDRLSRNVEEGMRICREVKVVSIFEHIHTLEDAERKLRQSEDEYKKTSAKSKASLRQCKLDRLDKVFDEEGYDAYIISYIYHFLHGPQYAEARKALKEYECEFLHKAIMLGYMLADVDDNNCDTTDKNQATRIAECTLKQLQDKKVVNMLCNM